MVNLRNYTHEVKDMSKGKFISYIRVSTGKQGRSGLGLEAQRKSIQDYVQKNNWTVLQEFIEVDSGKNDERKQLKLALEACKRTGSKLLLAKLDRLSRDVAFIANLMKSKAEFVCCDFPEANSFTIHILSAMGEYERELIANRTRNALKAWKERNPNKKLGKKENLTDTARAKGRVEAVKSIRNKADEYTSMVYPIIKELQNQGMSLHAIARKLSSDGELTARGTTAWDATKVRNVLKRVEGQKD